MAVTVPGAVHNAADAAKDAAGNVVDAVKNPEATVQKAGFSTAPGSGYINVQHVKPQAGRLNMFYVKTLAFLLRFVAIIFAVIVLICIGSAKLKRHNFDDFIYFTAGFALIFLCIVQAVYLLSIPFLLAGITSTCWVMVLMLFHIVWTIFYFIGGCLCIDASRVFDHCNGYEDRGGCGNSKDAWGAGAAFCWFAAIVHGILAFLAFRAFMITQKGDNAFGQVTNGIHGISEMKVPGFGGGHKDNRGLDSRDYQNGRGYGYDDRRGPSTGYDDRRGPSNGYDDRRGPSVVNDDRRGPSMINNDDRRGDPRINDGPRKGNYDYDQDRGYTTGPGYRSDRGSNERATRDGRGYKEGRGNRDGREDRAYTIEPGQAYRDDRGHKGDGRRGYDRSPNVHRSGNGYDQRGRSYDPDTGVTVIST